MLSALGFIMEAPTHHGHDERPLSGAEGKISAGRVTSKKGGASVSRCGCESRVRMLEVLGGEVRPRPVLKDRLIFAAVSGAFKRAVSGRDLLGRAVDGAVSVEPLFFITETSHLGLAIV